MRVGYIEHPDLQLCSHVLWRAQAYCKCDGRIRSRCLNTDILIDWGTIDEALPLTNLLLHDDLVKLIADIECQCSIWKTGCICGVFQKERK
jgi:hypothetical protein